MSKNFKVVANNINIGKWNYEVELNEKNNQFFVEVSNFQVDKKDNSGAVGIVVIKRFDEFNDSLDFFVKLLRYLKNHMRCPENWNERQFIETIDYNLMLLKNLE